MSTGAGDGIAAAGGGPARHIPVLLDEVIAALAPRPGEVFLDGTFGAGGYTRAILNAGASVIAIDRDPDAIASGRAMEAQLAGRLRLVQGRFSDLDIHGGQGALDGVVLDIGVSSMQLDEGERGFSFRQDGPLDMRMSQSGPSAAEIVNHADLNDLIRIIGILGEERQASRIARAIVSRRAARPFPPPADRAALVGEPAPAGPRERIHPATRTFQALRIHVNDELGELGRALFAAERALTAGGRLAVVTFHSLEDRIVKRFLADRSGGVGGSRHLPEVKASEPTFRLPKRGAQTPTEGECAANPRARSAKLRSAIRTEAPARSAEMSLFGLPRLPAAETFKETSR
mgnify:CR=1 FL=1